MDINKSKVGRPTKSLDEKKRNESEYNRRYYNSKIKTRKVLNSIAQRHNDNASKLNASAYRKAIVDAFSIYNFSHFFTGTSNPNYMQRENLRLLNKEILAKNNEYATNFSLMKYKRISSNGLMRYANKYLLHLLESKCIDRAIIFFETNKSGEWHVHILFNVINEHLVDVNHYVEGKWLIGISLNVAIQNDNDKAEILKYSTKQIDLQKNTKPYLDKNLYWNIVGDFTTENTKNMKEIQQDQMSNYLKIYKLKNHLVVKLDVKRQQLLENKFVRNCR